MAKYDSLKLENQLCFPLYAASKEIVRRYKEPLDRLGITYTQYIALLVLWEQNSVSVKEIGNLLYLDSGTLTPVLKTLEQKGFIKRERSAEDERVVNISLTKKGENLREQALEVPKEVGKCVKLESSEAKKLYTLLYKILAGLEE